uniref:Uncharacterized protein n=1 Tax=Timspurckia oligopyrenoides TaxID=708627 RepID=A0A7S0ZFP8_9RHOD|mmetsp:Transcript_3417/g.5979  ORF Transcript_3417/g.5979 Transcript_3417/m.5979 type:complete len:274 (+) Transcript_3417:452-1273(+)
MCIMNMLQETARFGGDLSDEAKLAFGGNAPVLEYGVGAVAVDSLHINGRRNGRLPHQMQDLMIEFGALTQADGSSSVTIGMTQVVASVFGPVSCPLRAQEHDCAVLQLQLRALPSCASRDQIVSLERILRDALAGCIDMKLFPRALIHMSVFVLSDDGSVLASAFNAAVCALLHAKIPMRSTPAAATACISASGDQMVLINPDLEEETVARSVVTVATLGESLALIHTEREVGDEQLFTLAFEAAVAASKVTLGCIQRLLRAQVKRDQRLLND